MKKYFLLVTLMTCAAVTTVMAQSGTNSPYSQYGLGKLADQSIGMSRGMNGVGIAFRESGHVNYLNPASYSSIDSLTFVFDIGMSLQNTNFKENGKSKNAKNGDFEYAVASFRALKHLGMSFGLMPYTNVGYNYSTKSSTIPNYTLVPSTQETTTITDKYSGSGGLHQIFLGAGWEPIRNFSVGMNVNYLFGNISNVVSSTFSDAAVKTTTMTYATEVNAIRLDLGASHTIELKDRNSVTVGLSFSPGYKLGSDWDYTVLTYNPTSSLSDTTSFSAVNAVAIPTQWGAGVSYKHANKWLVGFDYMYQRWGSLETKVYINDNTGATLQEVTTDGFSDRHKFTVGGQYCKNEHGRYFTDRIRYRFGAGYSSSYLKINGKDGPSELSVSAGVGIPIMNGWNSRSMINVSLQWQHASASKMITENTFLINIGLTFNERWFAKWKFD